MVKDTTENGGSQCKPLPKGMPDEWCRAPVVVQVALNLNGWNGIGGSFFADFAADSVEQAINRMSDCEFLVYRFFATSPAPPYKMFDIPGPCLTRLFAKYSTSESLRVEPIDPTENDNLLFSIGDEHVHDALTMEVFDVDSPDTPNPKNGFLVPCVTGTGERGTALA